MSSDRPHSRGLPVRNVRLDDERWTRITTEAARTNATASDVIRAALDTYLGQQA